jgi:hypothetical protein
LCSVPVSLDKQSQFLFGSALATSVVAVQTKLRVRLVMLNEKKERWMELCEQASKEQDPVKLSELIAKMIAEIDRMRQEEQDGSNGLRTFSTAGR